MIGIGVSLKSIAGRAYNRVVWFLASGTYNPNGVWEDDRNWE